MNKLILPIIALVISIVSLIFVLYTNLTFSNFNSDRGQEQEVKSNEKIGTDILPYGETAIGHNSFIVGSQSQFTGTHNIAIDPYYELEKTQ